MTDLPKPLKVTVYADSNGTHLHQIYTGLDLLERKREIKLRLVPLKTYTKGRPNRQFLAIRVHSFTASAVIIFDMQDSSELGLPESLEKCDLYFKRSYQSAYYEDLNDKLKEKIRPFGLNYQVAVINRSLILSRIVSEILARPFNPFSRKNLFHLHNVKELLDLNFSRKIRLIPDIEEIQPSQEERKFSVLFICRLWDPESLSEKNRADAHAINQSRIKIVRALRERLGSRFLGGIQKTSYAEKVATDLVIKDRKLTSRNNYLKLVKQSEVVISTSGLLGSIGWKFGEYVALGKAIISEPIINEVPGDFQRDKHYLQFRSSDECERLVEKLLKDKNLIRYLERNVEDYYWQYLEPKSLMKNCFNQLKL